MKIKDLMKTPTFTVHPTDNLNQAVKVMWDKRIGALPVIDEDSRIVGMLTDRDACMAAYTKGRALSEISVDSAMARQVHSCSADDDVGSALKSMRELGVRRLPVVDKRGHVEGILSVDDIARVASARPSGNAVKAADVSAALAELASRSGDTARASL